MNLSFASVALLALGHPVTATSRARGVRSLTKNKNAPPRSLKRKSKKGGSKCDEFQVLLLGETLFNPAFAATTTVDFLPKPLDRDVLNLPLYDPKVFFKDGTETQIGTIQETVDYLPPAVASFDDIDSLECKGQSVWTFPGKGQFSDSYSCQGEFPLISGGSGDFECALGYSEVLKITDDFFEGGGYIVWNIVTCNSCES
jgi:hypothetical protein